MSIKHYKKKTNKSFKKRHVKSIKIVLKKTKTKMEKVSQKISTFF